MCAPGTSHAQSWYEVPREIAFHIVRVAIYLRWIKKTIAFIPWNYTNHIVRIWNAWPSSDRQFSTRAFVNCTWCSKRHFWQEEDFWRLGFLWSDLSSNMPTVQNLQCQAVWEVKMKSTCLKYNCGCETNNVLSIKKVKKKAQKCLPWERIDNSQAKIRQVRNCNPLYLKICMCLSIKCITNGQ